MVEAVRTMKMVTSTMQQSIDQWEKGQPSWEMTYELSLKTEKKSGLWGVKQDLRGGQHGWIREQVCTGV